jgi:chitin synthase
MFVYLLSLPIWNFVLPAYAYWKFDDFSWGDTRKTAGEKTKKAGLEYEGEFDSSKITMKRWHDFEAGKPPLTFQWCGFMTNAGIERRLKAPSTTGGGWSQQSTTSAGGWPPSQQSYEASYYEN